jgi:hypothetical protein
VRAPVDSALRPRALFRVLLKAKAGAFFTSTPGRGPARDRRDLCCDRARGRWARTKPSAFSSASRIGRRFVTRQSRLTFSTTSRARRATSRIEGSPMLSSLIAEGRESGPKPGQLLPGGLRQVQLFAPCLVVPRPGGRGRLTERAPAPPASRPMDQFQLTLSTTGTCPDDGSASDRLPLQSPLPG